VIFPTLKFFAGSTHKSEVFRAAGEAGVWRSLTSPLVEGMKHAVAEEEDGRERRSVQAVP